MLVNIQFLRFAAALLVVLYHASYHVNSTGVDKGLVFTAGEAVGFAGVDVFFMISGFIMSYTTANQKGTQAGFEFIKRRLARIYSGYWPFFLLGLLVFSWARSAHAAESNLLNSFLLWPQPLNRVLLDVSWTLSFELYFYFVFSLLLLVGLRQRFGLFIGFAVLVAGFNIYRHWYQLGFSPENLHSLGFFDQFLTSPFLIEFLAGALLATTMKTRSLRSGWLALLAGIAGFIIAGWVNLEVYGGAIEQGYYTVPRVLIFGTPSLFIVFGLVQLEQNGVVAPRRFSLATGGASYALYLCHTLFFVTTMKLGVAGFLRDWSSWQVQVFYGVYVALIVAFSVCHYYFIEQPLHRIFKRGLLPEKYAQRSSSTN